MSPGGIGCRDGRTGWSPDGFPSPSGRPLSRTPRSPKTAALDRGLVLVVVHVASSEYAFPYSPVENLLSTSCCPIIGADLSFESRIEALLLGTTSLCSGCRPTLRRR